MTEDMFRDLAEADPAKDAPRFDPSSAKGAEVLRRAMAPPAPKPLLKRRGPRLITVAVVGAAAVAAAAGAFVNIRQPDHVLSVSCFGGLPPARAIGVSTQRMTAVDACWKMWNAGKFAPTPTPERLIACVANGAVGVYPGGPETCARLGAPLAPDDVRAARELVRLSDNLVEAFREVPCITPGRARVLAREAIADAKVKDWAVVDSPRPFDDEQPCAVGTIDEANRHVVIEPRGRPSS